MYKTIKHDNIFIKIDNTACITMFSIIETHPCCVKLKI